MTEPMPYPQEAERLACLRNLQLLDTPLEERFERITRLVCQLLEVPVAVFNLIDEKRQHFKAVRGYVHYNAPLPHAFCTHTLHEDQMLLVPDMSKDERFCDNPFVNGERFNIAFYAGVPIRSPDGMPIGTLCAVDFRPREMSEEQLNSLRDLAAMLETELKVSALSRVQRNLIHELGEANRLAMIDPLTRLWNRQGIEELLKREWSEALRESKPVTLILADIDHLKTINTTFGPEAGDCILRNAAKKLVECLRAEDAVGRMGGEEFLILLNGTAPEKVAGTLERIRTAIATAPLFIGQPACPVTMCFGAATHTPRTGEALETLLSKTETALRAAQSNGCNCVELA